MQIFCGHGVYFSGGYLLDLGLILIQPVRRISVVLVRHTLDQDLVRRVESENERVENGTVIDVHVRIAVHYPEYVAEQMCSAAKGPARTQELLSIIGQVANVFVHSLYRFNRALALGAHRNLQHTGMAEVGADPATHSVGQAALGPDVVE